MNPAESPFTATARILNEASNGFDNLRIIAKDVPGLSAEDRRNIRAAADELESCQKAHLHTYTQLIETQGKLAAVNELLLETTQKLLQTKKACVSPLSQVANVVGLGKSDRISDEYSAKVQIMPEEVTPKPMPTTGWPDRVDSLNPPTDMDMRAGMKSGTMEVNPGKPPKGAK